MYKVKSTYEQTVWAPLLLCMVSVGYIHTQFAGDLGSTGLCRWYHSGITRAATHTIEALEN